MARIPPGASISLVRRALSQTLRDGGCESADADARLLMQIALGLDHSGLIRQDARPLDLTEISRVESLAARRLTGEPIARIAGVKEFWGLRLALGPATLIPRPETETLVEAALAWIATRDNGLKRHLHVADLGTGSGALLLALLTEAPHAWGVGTDISEAAVSTAAANARRFGLTIRATFAVCNFGSALDGGFDLIVSNPPYIATAAIASLAPDVRDFDPLRALDGGEDGLDAYRIIARDAKRLLRPGGAIIVELGASQAESVTDIFRAEHLAVDTPARSDLSGILRALTALKP